FNRPTIPGQFYPEVGFLFQDPSDQLFSASVRDDIAFAPKNMGLSPEEIDRRVRDAIALCGIEALADRPPHHLSGGEKQMVAIAGILAMHPRIVLYDEPTASLDLRARRRLIQFLRQSEETLLIASHDLEFILETCDRVIVMATGTIGVEGSSSQVMGDRDLMERYGLETPYSLR
ncbi:MAG: ABC transporter ATP-binding protein, partial [Cyanobacteriota bacterium]|nr:ABC transporter ATP-binding protein [Cyanobacteriota bacterium]